MRILVVDDQKLNLKVAESYIKMASNEYSIILCENPLKVMGILEEEPIDIILLDIMMSGREKVWDSVFHTTLL